MKIVLLLRNPVEAFYSMYKMHVRMGKDNTGYNFYREYNPKMFDLFFEKWKENMPYLYDGYIHEFLNVYGSDHVHIVLFEEFIRKPQEIVNQIYNYLQIDSEYNLYCLPKVADGNWVFATREGFLIGKEKQRCNSIRFRNPTSTIFETDEYKKICEEYEKAEKIYAPKMEAYQREYLQEFFYSSVRELEKIIRRDLSEVWF